MEEDTPLPEPTLATLRTRWTQLYHNHDFGPRFTPADTLVARLWREISRRTPQVHNVAKTRNLLHAALPNDYQQLAFGQATLTIGQQEGIDVSSIVEDAFRRRDAA